MATKADRAAREAVTEEVPLNPLADCTCGWPDDPQVDHRHDGQPCEVRHDPEVLASVHNDDTWVEAGEEPVVETVLPPDPPFVPDVSFVPVTTQTYVPELRVEASSGQFTAEWADDVFNPAVKTIDSALDVVESEIELLVQRRALGNERIKELRNQKRKLISAKRALADESQDNQEDPS